MRVASSVRTVRSGSPESRRVAPRIPTAPVVTISPASCERPAPTPPSSRCACGVAGATQADVTAFEQAYRSNTNPVVSDVVVTRGDRVEAVADGAEIIAAPGEVLRVRASWPACNGSGACGGAESYPAFDVAARVLVPRREAMRVSWLATRGRFGDARSGRDEPDEARDVETTWTAPAAADGVTSAVLWIVVRDARGGTGMRSLRVRIGS
jgi:hypothetical protein